MKTQMIGFLMAGILAGILAGCANSPLMIRGAPAESLKSVPTAKLCLAYQYNNDPKVLDEIHSRDEFPEDEFELVAVHQIKVGMSKQAVLCSWGDGYIIGPGTRNQAMEKWLYWQGTAYVFMHDDKVVNFQK